MMMNRIKLLNLYKSATTLINPINKNVVVGNRLFIANYSSSGSNSTQSITNNDNHKSTTVSNSEPISNKLQITESIDVKPYFKNALQFNDGPRYDEYLSNILSNIIFQLNSNSELKYNILLSKLTSVKNIESEIKSEMVSKIQSIDNIKLIPIKIFLLSVSSKDVKSNEQKINELIKQVEQNTDSETTTTSTLLKYCNYSNWFGKVIKNKEIGGTKKSKHIKLLEFLKLNSNEIEFQSIFKGNSKFLQELYMFRIHDELNELELNELKSTKLFSSDYILSNIYSTIYRFPVISSLWSRMYILLGYKFEQHMYLDIQNALFSKNLHYEIIKFRKSLIHLGYYPTTLIDEQFFSNLRLISPYDIVVKSYKEIDQTYHHKNLNIQISMIKFLLNYSRSMETEKKKQITSFPKLDSPIHIQPTTATTTTTDDKLLLLYSILENNKSIQLYNVALKHLINGPSSDGNLLIFRNIIELLIKDSSTTLVPNYETLDTVYQFFSKFKRFNDKQMFDFINQFSVDGTNSTLSESDHFNLSIKIAILKNNLSLAMESFTELHKLGLPCYKSTMELLIKTDPNNPVWVSFYKQQQQQQQSIDGGNNDGNGNDGNNKQQLIDSDSFLSMRDPVSIYNHLKSNSIEIKDSTCLELIPRLLKVNEISIIDEIISNKFSNNQYFKNQNNLWFLKRLISIKDLPISNQDLIQFESILLSDGISVYEKIKNTKKLLGLAVSRKYNDLVDKYNDILNTLFESANNIDLIDPTNSNSLLYLNLVTLQTSTDITIAQEEQDQFISKYINTVDLNDSNVKYSILLAFYHMVTGFYNRGSSNNNMANTSPLSSSPEFYLKIRSKLNLNPDEPIVNLLSLELYVLDKIILKSFHLYGKYYNSKQSKLIFDNPLFTVAQLESIIISNLKFNNNGKVTNISKLLSHFIELKPKINEINQFYNHFIENPNDFKYLDEPTIKYLMSLGVNQSKLINCPFYTVFCFKYYLSINDFATAFNHYFVNVSPFIQFLILDKQLLIGSGGVGANGIENPFISKLLSEIESKQIHYKPISNLLRVSTISNSPLHFEFSCLLFNKLVDIKFGFINSLINSKDLLLSGTTKSISTNYLVDKEIIKKIQSNVKLSNHDSSNYDDDDDDYNEDSSSSNSSVTGDQIGLSMNSNQCVLKIKDILLNGSFESLRSLKDEIKRQKIQLSLIDKCRIYIMVNECGESMVPKHKLQRLLKLFKIDVPPTHLYNDQTTNKLLFSMGSIKKFEELFTRVNNTYSNNPYVSVDTLFRKFKPEYQTFDIKNNPKDIQTILKYNLNKFK